MKKLIALTLSILFASATNAQQVGVGQWRDHLPYNKGVSVAPAINRIYVAVETGVFYYDLKDNSVTRLSKVSGLSDIGSKVVRYNKEYKTLVIGYNNGNMDLIIDGKTIENYSDIKRSTSILGLKQINNVMFSGSTAYIATNFGISVFDLIDKEFKETYIIGPGGANLGVNQTATDGVYLYAATDTGLFKATLSNPFLNDFNNWSRVQLPVGLTKRINAVCYVNNKLYVNYSNKVYNSDTCYVWDGSNWSERLPGFNWTTNTLNVYDNKLLVTTVIGSFLYDDNGTAIKSITSLDDNTIQPSDGALDDLGNLWVADGKHGAQVSGGNLGYNKVTPIGPQQKNTLYMAYNNGNIWTVPGGTIYYEFTYNYGQVSKYNGTEWMNRTQATDTVLNNSWDYMNVAIDPTDPNHAYFSSWGRGLIELKNNEFTRYHNSNTTQIKPIPDNSQRELIGGVAFQDNGRIWFTNALSTTAGIITRGTDGVFQSFDFGAILNNKYIGQITIDSYNQKWVILGRGAGILVFKDENGAIPFNKRKVISTGAGAGALPENDVRAIVEDKENQIWVGTAKGVCVFYSPEAVFSGNNFDAQKPGIVEGGFFYPLLENEVVTCIAVDGANRKWIGTEKGGLFLISADGSKQIHNFNIDNSPLLSNTIFSIAINAETGEVFVATDQGIVSYRGDATEGEDAFGKVYAFPNPVRPNYTGPISIRGLAKDVDVKITDIAGRVVYQTKANGGTAVWDGNGFNGERAHSGVYLVFSANTDGTKTNVTKIMIVD